MKRVLCMGSINIDLVMYMDRMPVPGETVVTDNFATFPGGKGGNQAAACASFGVPVSYLTCMGDDDFSNSLLKEQRKRGVNTDHILIREGETAGIAMIRVDSTAQNSISFTPGANQLLTAKDVQESEKVFEQHDILLITMEINLDTAYAAIQMAHQHGMTIVLDPAPAPMGGIPEDIAKLVHFVKPNESEAEILTGLKVKTRADAEVAVRKLAEIGFHTPIITLADEGLVALIDGEAFKLDAIKVNSIDSTAAGDIFLGAFVAALAKGKENKYCLQFANHAAALSTTRKGAQSSIPKLQEVLTQIESFN